MNNPMWFYLEHPTDCSLSAIVWCNKTALTSNNNNNKNNLKNPKQQQKLKGEDEQFVLKYVGIWRLFFPLENTDLFSLPHTKALKFCLSLEMPVII